MERRNTALGDQIIVQLGQFAIDELGLGGEVARIVEPLAAPGRNPDRVPIIRDLWHLILANDPQPDIDVAAYLNDTVLGELARSAVAGRS